MRNLITVMLCFNLCMLCAQQIDNLDITYKVKINRAKKSDNRRINLIFEQIDSIEIKLLYAYRNAFFGLLNPDDYPENIEAAYALKTARNLAGVSNTWYNYDLNKRETIQTQILSETVYNIYTDFDSLDWKFVNETRTIKGYTCYKATRIKPVKDRNGIITNVEIIAWYAPSIPIAMGIKENVGLKGLILELHEVGRSLYYATDIRFNVDEIINIKAIRKGEKVTRKEFDQILEGSYNYFILEKQRN